MLATAIWDILGIQSLFSSAFYSHTEVMCQTVDTIGPLTAEWKQKWTERAEFFDYQGHPKANRHEWPRLSDAFEERVAHFRRKDNMGVFSSKETMAILTLMTQMLKLKPDDRPSINQILESDWMVQWAQRDYEAANPTLHTQ